MSLFPNPKRIVLCGAARRQGKRLLQEFDAACRDVQGMQAQVLREILATQADSERGRAHGFSKLGSPALFRSQMPISTYDDVRPWIDKMRRTGDTRVMFAPDQQLIMYAMTSGSESEPKYIPVTEESYRRYRRGWSMWVCSAVRDYPRCFDHKIAAIVSPPVEDQTEHGVPCGSMSGLSTRTQSRFIRSLYGIPAPLYGLSNQASKYYAISRCAASHSVSFLVTANPSSLLMIAQTLDAHREDIIRDIHNGTLSVNLAGESAEIRQVVSRLRRNPRRARFLEQVAEKTGGLKPKDIWPELAIITNWKGGTLGHYLDLYPEQYGNVPVRDIGLLASEGRMTIPMSDEGSAGPLDLFGHFFEFIPIEEEDSRDPNVLMAHELQVGKQYLIVLTNFGGLHRYNISDVIQVEGFMHECPIVRFLHKGSRFSSITGEKLTEHQVVHAVRDAAGELGLRLTDFILVPVFGQPPCYALIAGANALGPREHWEEFLRRTDMHMQNRNIEYLSKRKSMRLGHIRLGVVDCALFDNIRLERIAASGGRSEQYKPTFLTGDLEFHRGLEILEEISADGEHVKAPMLIRTES